MPPTVEQVVAHAIARERQRCAEFAREQADILLGQGQWETAALFEQLAQRITETGDVPAPPVDPGHPTPVATSAGDGSAHATDDDERDYRVIAEQVRARVFNSGYGRD